MDPAVSSLDPPPLSAPRPAWLMLGLVLVALNLRPALSSVAPVLAQVQQALGLSGTAAGLVTTLPVLCLGLFAPLAPRLAQRFGVKQTVFAVLRCEFQRRQHVAGPHEARTIEPAAATRRLAS